MTLRIHLFGRHANRTPPAYPVYRQLLRRFVDYVESPEDADLLILGFRADISENFEPLLRARDRRPNLRLLVVSEEPLWDTLWSGDFRALRGEVKDRLGVIQYTALNHFTSDIFDWRSLPYFITTSDDFYARYRNYYLRNVKLSRKALLHHFTTRPTHNAFFCERRVDSRFAPTRADAKDLGLSVTRSLFAEKLQSLGHTIREGRGWHSDQTRQRLPDWHLDKLVQLDRQSLFVSAIENTLVDHYLTEKIFDAYAVLSIPLYAAGFNHRVYELVHRRSFVNLLNVPPDNAPETLQSFAINERFVDAYYLTQCSLLDRFLHVDVLHEERVGVVRRLVHALESPADTPCPRAATVA